METSSWVRCALGIGALFLFAISRGLGADNSPDTTAKFLAGLAVPAAPATDSDQNPEVTDQPNAGSLTAPQQTAPPASASPASSSRRPGSLIPERQPHVTPSQALRENSSQLVNSSTPQHSNPWITHSTELDRAWKRTDQQLAAIANWAPDSLGPAYLENNTMFYMFSGPDFLYAHAFFPNARTYILCGTEPVGAIPDLGQISPQALPVALANVRKSLGSVLNWSFFITKDMKTDLTQAQLSGTLPLLYVFLARAGCTIDSVTPVMIDKTGAVTENGKGERAQSGLARVDGGAARVAGGASAGNASDQTSGVRIVFNSASQEAQTVYYFCTDLSDDGVKSKPGFMQFCAQQGNGVSMLKAASYLMHEPGFSRVREFLLAKSDIILQDDSGIPLRFLEGPDWNIRYCGTYVGPIDTFKNYWQPDLAAESARSAPAPLPFGFGYQWQPNRSGLMIVTRKETKIGKFRSDASSG